jgi:hypothetical protein
MVQQLVFKKISVLGVCSDRMALTVEFLFNNNQTFTMHSYGDFHYIKT